MAFLCPQCGKKWKENRMFCPECGTIGESLDESKREHKTTLDDKVYDYLSNEFDKVYAIGFDNVKRIDLYSEREPSEPNMRSRWIKESSSLVLNDGKPFLSVEMLSSASPIDVTGNILVHAITDFVAIKYEGRKRDVSHTIDNPRYLLIIIPDPTEGSKKDDQIPIIENLIKEMEIFEKTPIENFKISFKKDFEKSISELIQ